MGRARIKEGTVIIEPEKARVFLKIELLLPASVRRALLKQLSDNLVKHRHDKLKP
jgi:hypothetical protein